MADEGTWDEAKLMGIGEEGKGAEMIKQDPMLWGVPGYLTKEEAQTFVSYHFDCLEDLIGLFHEIL